MIDSDDSILSRLNLSVNRIYGGFLHKAVR